MKKIIALTQNDRRIALDYAQKIVQSNSFIRKNRSDEECIRCFYVGTLGEIAFAKYIDPINYLDLLSLDIIERENKSDLCDFVVVHANKHYTIDVKTKYHDDNQFTFNVNTHRLHNNITWYVGVKLINNSYDDFDDYKTAEIIGYFSGYQAMMHNRYVRFSCPYRIIKFNELSDIDELSKMKNFIKFVNPDKYFSHVKSKVKNRQNRAKTL